MDNERKQLKATLLNKETNQELLANLERLKAQGSISAQKYDLLKADYQQKMTAAVSEISSIKSRLKLRLEEVKNRLNLLNVELEELRARHDAGELSLNAYQRAERKQIEKIRDTKKGVLQLQSLADAKSSSQLIPPKVAFPRWALITSASAAAIILLCIGLLTVWFALGRPPIPPLFSPKAPTTEEAAPTPPTTEEPTPPFQWAEAIAAIEPAIVEVQSDNITISGVIIDKDGLILTVSPNITADKPVTISLPSKEQYEGKIIGRDEKTNLAIIRIAVDNVALPFVGIGDSGVLKPGEEVAAVGYSTETQGDGETGTGTITEIVEEDGVNRIHTDIPFDLSKVGGALINTNRELVGIVVGHYDAAGDAKGGTFAIAIDEAKPLIEQAMAEQ